MRNGAGDAGGGGLRCLGLVMGELRVTLVFTTIYGADVLGAYCRNFERYGHLHQVEVIVIPDRKTPLEAYHRAREVNSRGMRTSCPEIEEQDAYLRRVGLAPELIPYNSDNRRNIGYLMALASGSDFLLSIDDDNYCTDDQDVFAEHSVVCQGPTSGSCVASPTGFYNVCRLLEFEGDFPVYARGFPYFRRHLDEGTASYSAHAEVHVNAGLWTVDPDIDAFTWLVCRPRVKAFGSHSVILAPDTWSPINTQNTSLHRDAIPAYYFLKMGYPIAGTPIDRYGDILSGYFVQACAKHLRKAVRVGSPYAEHRRNSHNYIRDAFQEIACIGVLEDLLPWLVELRLDGTSYTGAYAALSHALEDAVERFHGSIWTDATRGYFHQAAYYMRAWLKACEAITGGAGGGVSAKG